MDLIYLLLIVAIIILFYVLLPTNFLHRNGIQDVSELSDRYHALEIINIIGNNGSLLISHLNSKYPNNENFELLRSRYTPGNITEGQPGDTNFTYTENKKDIVLCVRNSNNKLHNINLVMYPFLHELAHMACEEHDPGHGPEFKRIFKIILLESEQLGIYQKIDFNNVPQEYCGMKIHNTMI